MKFFRNFKKVYKYSYGYRRYIIFYFILTIITSLVGIVSPLLLASLLVNLTNEVWNLVIIYTIFIFIVNVLGSFFSFVSQFLTEKFSRFVVSRIQLELGREILSLQLSDIDKHSNGVFIQRLTGDTSSICSIFTFGVSSFTGIISKFGIFIIVFAINKWIGLFFLIFMVIFFILQRVKNKKINDKDINYRDQRERTSGFTTEVIRGIRDIKMLNAENTFMKSVEEMLPKSRFVRVHRSYIVQPTKISVIDRNRIVFGKTYIPISDNYKQPFYEFLERHSLFLGR